MAAAVKEVRQAVGRGGRIIPYRLILATEELLAARLLSCEHHVLLLLAIDLSVSASLEAPTGTTTAIEAFLCKELHLKQKDAASSFITLLT